MSRINGSADTVFPGLVFFGCLIGYLLVDFFWLRKPCKPRSVPLTRGRIIFLSWGAVAVRVTALMIALCMLPTLALLYGRIAWGGWIGSVCIMLCITWLPLWIRLRWIWHAMPLIHGKRRIPLPENAMLDNTDGTWFYQDKDWYIRMGKDIFALLYAPRIDFESPDLFWVTREAAMKGSAYIHCLHFKEKEGGICRAWHPRDERIGRWVQRHSGRLL